SSRRRHTRSKRDWSSDVCSSDLLPGEWSPVRSGLERRCAPHKVRESSSNRVSPARRDHPVRYTALFEDVGRVASLFREGENRSRSEERRVGKECISGCSRGRWKK